MRQLMIRTGEMLRDRRFLKKALMIACPVALQGMLNTVVNMVDTLMIGGLGSSAIAAVGLANKYFFVFSLLVFGIVSGAGILAAQYWGNGDVKSIRKCLCPNTGAASSIGLIYSPGRSRSTCICAPGIDLAPSGDADLYNQ